MVAWLTGFSAFLLLIVVVLVVWLLVLNRRYDELEKAHDETLDFMVRSGRAWSDEIEDDLDSVLEFDLSEEFEEESKRPGRGSRWDESQLGLY